MVNYTITQQDSILLFDPAIRFSNDAVFRDQQVDIMLNIPYDYPFVMTEEFAMFIENYVPWENARDHTWVLTRNGLECRDCKGTAAGGTREFSDFDAIELSGAFDATIRHGNQHTVELSGPEGEREKYDVYQSGRTLVIDYEGRRKFDFKLKDIDIEPVHLTITVVNLQSIEAVGYGRLRLDDITTDDLHIDLKGPVRARGVLTAKNITIDMTGSAEADFSGTAESLNADINFASRLDADGLEVTDADIEANGASTADVNVTGNLTIEERLGSKVEYRGNPRVVVVDR